MESGYSHLAVKIKHLGKWIADAFFPEYCLGCKREGTLFCDQCREKILPFPLHRLLEENFFVDAFYSYADPRIRALLAAYKFESKRSLENIFEMAVRRGIEKTATWIPGEPVLLVPIPLHKRRQRERGFNQSLELAKFLSAHFPEGTVVTTLLKRIRPTKQQSALPKTARAENVANCFYSEPITIKEKRIACVLVDDVVTSGETLRAAKEALVSAGYTVLGAWTFAYGGDDVQ